MSKRKTKSGFLPKWIRYSLAGLFHNHRIQQGTSKPAVTDVGIFYAFHPEIYARMGYCPALSWYHFASVIAPGSGLKWTGYSSVIGATWDLASCTVLKMLNEKCGWYTDFRPIVTTSHGQESEIIRIMEDRPFRRFTEWKKISAMAPFASTSHQPEYSMTEEFSIFPLRRSSHNA
jgi:hypothetical protein